jgi:alkylation response protein AidB-like acyl-CoA dehydrogenase
MQTFDYPAWDLPPAAEELRGEVREFLAEHLADYPPHMRANTWTGRDPEFSRKMGERGWIGMTWPKQYGGGERSAFERFVLLEEMLAAGAPVGAHWVADRQSGPLLLRYGTEEQRERLLPPITRGESFFCIGMSEPDSGSDLASIRSKAEKVEGGWVVNGTKVWTSGAHACHYMIALLRSSGTPEDRHSGLSQFLVDLSSDGIDIRPIRDLSGDAHFNQVTFTDVFVPENMLVGTEGGGWKQVMSELAYERSGPERYLSSFQLMVELIRELGPEAEDKAAEGIGRLIAHLNTLRRMTISLAGMLQAGEDPALSASVTKELGTTFEQEIPPAAQAMVDAEPTLAGGDFAQTLAFLTQVTPSFSLRGGTREIMRGMIARGLGLR